MQPYFRKQKNMKRFVILLVIAAGTFCAARVEAQNMHVATNLLDYLNFGTINAEFGLSPVPKWSYYIKGRYNPFALLYGKAPDNRQLEIISEALRAEIVGIENALDLVDRGERRDLFPILENILEFGMPMSSDRVIKKDNRKEIKSEGSI